MPTPPASDRRFTVLVAFGTRPEVIKLAPVVAELNRSPHFRTVCVSSGQHAELLDPFVRLFQFPIDHDLKVMRAGQPLTALFARVLGEIDPLLEREQPDAVLVQGDTTTAAAVALAAFHRRIPVGHVEAGLRSGDPLSPFPEEMNRQLVSRMARWHFAAHVNHARRLVNEGVPKANVFRTGNPVVDALQSVLAVGRRSERLKQVLGVTAGLKRID